MRSFILKLLLSLIIFFLVMSCAEYKGSIVGADFFQRNNPGSQAFIKVYPLSSDTSYHADISAGQSSRLILGSLHKRYSRTLMQFTSLPLEGQIDSAYLLLFLEKSHGEQAGAPSIVLHQITQDWQDTLITSSDLNSAGFLGDSLIVDVSVQEDTFRIPLPSDWIQSWIDTTAIQMNYGLSLGLAPEDTGAFYQFYSYEESTQIGKLPRLRLFYTEDTTQSNATIPPAQDVFVAWEEFAGRDDRLTVADGIARRILMFFPVDSIPNTATINLALLTMHLDTLLSYPDNGETFSLKSYSVTSPWEFPAISYDNSMGLSGYAEGDSATINITFFFQNWCAEIFENFGLIILGGNERNDILQRSFFSMSAEENLRPCLTVFYSLPPSNQW